MARNNTRPAVSSWWQERWRRWLDRRIPPAPTRILDRRHLFVFASRLGWWFLAALVLVFIAAVNYQNGLAMLLVFLMAAVGLLSILMAHHNMSGLSLTGLDIEPVFAGERGEMPILLKAGKPAWSVALGTSRDIQTTVDVPKDGSVLVRLKSQTLRRGVYPTERAYVETVYPFGLVRCWSWVHLGQVWVVYPRPIEPPEHMPSLREQQGDDGEPVASDEWGEARRYQPGDPVRRIDWRAYARTRKPYVRERQPESRGATIIDWDDYPGVDNERRLEFLCYRLLEAEKAGEDYALRLPGTLLPEGRGEAHLRLCLYALASFPGGRTP
jgi:uncharacterized protein (DUF58 family)